MDFKKNLENYQFKTIIYEEKNDISYITLNRPGKLNAIISPMPQEIKEAVRRANENKSIKMILISGNGRAFCSGYDLSEYAEKPRGSMECSQNMPWDPYIDYKYMNECTECYMSLWHSLKPTIAKVHGFAVGGGSDIALCCDIVVLAENAKIGYPPARIWGCPTTFMWVYRCGFEWAKRLLFTGELIDGKKAEKIGLISESVPEEKLDNYISNLVNSIKTVPTNQLFFQKLVINDAIEKMGLLSTQKLAVIFDGCTRHTPEGVEFQKGCEKEGFKSMIAKRDSIFKEEKQSKSIEKTKF